MWVVLTDVTSLEEQQGSSTRESTFLQLIFLITRRLLKRKSVRTICENDILLSAVSSLMVDQLVEAHNVIDAVTDESGRQKGILLMLNARLPSWVACSSTLITVRGCCCCYCCCCCCCCLLGNLNRPLRPPYRVPKIFYFMIVQWEREMEMFGDQSSDGRLL